MLQEAPRPSGDPHRAHPWDDVVARRKRASEQEAEKLADLLLLNPAITSALQEYLTKGSLDPAIPTDPLIYRFYEIM